MKASPRHRAWCLGQVVISFANMTTFEDTRMKMQGEVAPPGRMVGTVGHELATVHTGLSDRRGWAVHAPISANFYPDMQPVECCLVPVGDHLGDENQVGPVEEFEYVLLSHDELASLEYDGKPLGAARLMAWPRVERVLPGEGAKVSDDDQAVPRSAAGPLTRSQAQLSVAVESTKILKQGEEEAGGLESVAPAWSATMGALGRGAQSGDATEAGGGSTRVYSSGFRRSPNYAVFPVSRGVVNR